MIKYYCNQIEITSAHNLVGTTPMPHLRKMAVSTYLPWRKLDTVGLIQVEESEHLDKGQAKYEIKVKGKMMDVCILPPGPLVIRLTTTSGDHLIMGCEMRPFPTITTLKSYSSSASSGAGCYLTALLDSVYPLFLEV